jgi:hypothetical protein
MKAGDTRQIRVANFRALALSRCNGWYALRRLIERQGRDGKLIDWKDVRFAPESGQIADIGSVGMIWARCVRRRRFYDLMTICSSLLESSTSRNLTANPSAK